MRKISVGVLSVAGLLAVVLAIASGSVTAQTDDTPVNVVTFTTDTIPGDYTVKWSTQGTCDPTKKRDGTPVSAEPVSNSPRTRTVLVPPGTPATAKVVGVADGAVVTGDAVEFSITVATHCTYDFNVEFTSGLPGDKGERCVVDTLGAGASPNTRVGNNGKGIHVADTTVTAENRTGLLQSVQGVLIGENSDFGSNSNVGPVFAFDVLNAAVNCTEHQSITVTIGPTARTTGAGKNMNLGTYEIDSNFGHYNELNPTRGAILNSTFEVSANPINLTDQSPPDAECRARKVSAMTKVNPGTNAQSKNDDRVQASLRVLTKTLVTSKDCDYDLVAALPPGFDRFSVNPRDADNQPTIWIDHEDGWSNEQTVRADKLVYTPDTAYNDDPTDEDAGRVTKFGDCASAGGLPVQAKQTGTGTPSALPAKVEVTSQLCGIQLHVTVANRSVYITQSVVGDAGGANARYELTGLSECGIPDDLPRNLLARESGGIVTTTVTVVELREGHFNISKAVMPDTDEDSSGRWRARRLALNSNAEPCVATAKVTHLPENCSAAANPQSVSLVDDVNDKGRVVMRFDINCVDPAPADDGGDMAGDDGDMMAGDDDDAASGDMGPVMDTPTG